MKMHTVFCSLVEKFCEIVIYCFVCIGLIVLKQVQAAPARHRLGKLCPVRLFLREKVGVVSGGRRSGGREASQPMISALTLANE